MKKLCFFYLLVLLSSCSKVSKDKEYTKLSGAIFGTTYNMTYLDSSDIDYREDIDSIFAMANQSLSTYISDSDISKINRGEEGVFVDYLFAEVFQKSDRIYEESQGFFDPTIGLVVNAWGFGPEVNSNPPDSSRIRELMKYVGFDKVKLNKDLVVKDSPKIYFDFNAIAKGYGVDLIGRFFESQGIKNYLIEIGGEIRARGSNPEGNAWRIAIEKPNSDGTRSLQEIVSLENESIATSGNYRKYKIDPNTGKKYVHTIDAQSGFASQNDLLSVSVISTLDCADVDAYATAFMAMGKDKTLSFLENRLDLKVFLIYLDEGGQNQVYKNW
jgi:thiamine biosynthesis lipoprotein